MEGLESIAKDGIRGNISSQFLHLLHENQFGHLGEGDMTDSRAQSDRQMSMLVRSSSMLESEQEGPGNCRKRYLTACMEGILAASEDTC